MTSPKHARVAPRSHARVRRVERCAPWVGVAVAASALLLVGVLTPGAPAGAQDGPDPTVDVSETEVAVGDTVDVDLAGWPVGPALVEVCGNGAQRGSVDCDIVGGTAVDVESDGRATTPMVIGTPPVPCPCVVRVSSRIQALARTAPLSLSGVAGSGVEVPVPTGARSFEIEDVRVVDDADPTALFGAAAKRRLELRIRNTGSVAIAPQLSVSLGDGDAPRAIEVPDVPEIPPGEVASVRATFHLPAFTFGREAVTGRVDGADEPIRFTASASTIPWGLLIVGALAAYLVLLRLVVASVVRLRRRRGAAAVAPADVAVVQSAPSGLAAATFAAAFPSAAATVSPPADATTPTPVAPTAVPTGVRVPDVPVGQAHTSAAGSDTPVGQVHTGSVGAVVGRWDLFGAATPEIVLAALFDAGAPEDAVRRQLDSLPLTAWRLHVTRTVGDDGVVATSVVLDPGPADGLRRLGSVRALLEAGQLTEGTFRLARRALGFLADASPTGAIPADPATILATVAACAAVDALGLAETVAGPVTLGHGAAPTDVTVELLRSHGIPWRATTEPVDPPAPAALAVVAATAAPSGEVGPATTTAVGRGTPSVDRATRPGAARLLVGRNQPAPAPMSATTLPWGFTPDDAPTPGTTSGSRIEA